MSKKVMILSGSPVKKGNTSILAEWFAHGAREKGAEVEIVPVSELKYSINGCISCRRCQASERFECAIDDDVKSVLARMPGADIIVMATPMYFFGPTAQLKIIVDRMMSLYKFNDITGETRTPLKDKTLILLASAGGAEGLDVMENTFKIIAGFSGMRFESLIVPDAGKSGDIKNKIGVREKASEFGRRFI